MNLSGDDEVGVTRVPTDYYKAFSTLDAKAVEPYFHEPSQLISSAGSCRHRRAPVWPLHFNR
jgi:hypothetical protein